MVPLPVTIELVTEYLYFLAPLDAQDPLCVVYDTAAEY